MYVCKCMYGSVFGDRFWHCNVEDSCIRGKTALFSFENGLVWRGPYMYIHTVHLKLNQLQLIKLLLLH